MSLAMITPMNEMAKDMPSLVLIERLCAVYEDSGSIEHEELASELMRVIRAVAIKGRVVLISNGPAATLLKSQMADEKLLWETVSIEDAT
jgi:hypothetical protein